VVYKKTVLTLGTSGIIVKVYLGIVWLVRGVTGLRFCLEWAADSSSVCRKERRSFPKTRLLSEMTPQSVQTIEKGLFFSLLTTYP
jgi:hypothetical protein